MSEAQAENVRKALELTLAGPRREDIDQAKAQLDAAQADLALLKRQLADLELISPTDGVVRNRLMEPGELATPQRPIVSIAITNPKWIRAYVSEADLRHIRIGTPASVTVDSAADSPLRGTVKFISSTAEFTPKTVQTEELRTSLVYEVRVFVEDNDDRLRLGMPATEYGPFTVIVVLAVAAKVVGAIVDTVSDVLTIPDAGVQQTPDLGVGIDVRFVAGIAQGVDLFDCVIPTRHARHGMLFTREGGLAIRNARFAGDVAPIDSACDCPACLAYSRGYLRHLFQVNDALGPVGLCCGN